MPVMLSAAVFLIHAAPAQAASGRSGGVNSIGLTFGLAFPSGTTNIFTFGINSLYRLFGNVGGGLFYQHYGIDASFASGADSAQLAVKTTYYGIEPQYIFTGTLEGFIGGLRIGMANSSKSASSTNSSGTIDISSSKSQLFIAPKLAYDYPVGRFSVGGDASYTMGFGGNAPKAVLIQLTSKFWF